ncbi:zinc transporter ZupT [Candidatus Poribacteria bacterium]|nr:zinc transporter ZupT [Candidatus Poribacteria bacterium]
MEANYFPALLLVSLAGLSTTVGSAIGIFVRKPGNSFMAFTLGFAAGVMILVSFVELLAGAIAEIGFAPAHLAFFGGIVFIFLLDLAIPHEYGAEHHKTEEQAESPLLRTGLLIALGIGIHNFPEGMVTFAGALEDIKVGVAIAVAIGIHNIPEGLAVSVPVFAATGSRKKAFLWSFLSGLSEPIGATLAALILLPFLNETLLGVAFAAVAGIMVFISLDELVPSAREYEKGHLAILGVILGMMVMAVSLWLLGAVNK